jgi:hypothetical protein
MDDRFAAGKLAIHRQDSTPAARRQRRPALHAGVPYVNGTTTDGQYQLHLLLPGKFTKGGKEANSDPY